MKLLNKITKLVVAALMTLSMGVTAFADTTTTTYTITGPADGHTYEVYQIFTGDLNGTTLSNVKWGANGTGTVGAAVDDTTLTTIAALANKTQATADAVSAYVNFSSTAVATLSDSTTTASVAPGYYLIKDTGKTTGTTDAYSTYVVSVVKDLTISPKRDVPSFEKKIQDINDTTDSAAGNLQDSADYDIGDDVPFTLTATVADNYADYTHYYFEFQDSMEESLTFNENSVVVTIDGKTVDSSKYTVTKGTVTEGGLGGDSFSVIFTDLKNTDATAGSKVVVTYTAKLNENAVLGSQGNVNEAKLVYSNNPNDKQSGKPETPGETPWDNVIVFTYKVVINKVDSQSQPLTGAEFTLSKKMKDGSTKAITTVKNEAGTSFTFNGLDDGEYILSETKTPAGYNTIADITFKVTAEHKIEWTTEARTDILTSLSGDKVSGEITMTSKLSEGSLTSDIVNKKGSELPSTGGIGTTIFYVVGGMMVVVAGVLLITKKRMSND